MSSIKPRIFHLGLVGEDNRITACLSIKTSRISAVYVPRNGPTRDTHRITACLSIKTSRISAEYVPRNGPSRDTHRISRCALIIGAAAIYHYINSIVGDTHRIARCTPLIGAAAIYFYINSTAGNTHRIARCTPLIGVAAIYKQSLTAGQLHCASADRICLAICTVDIGHISTIHRYMAGHHALGSVFPIAIYPTCNLISIFFCYFNSG